MPLQKGPQGAPLSLQPREGTARRRCGQLRSVPSNPDPLTAGSQSAEPWETNFSRLHAPWCPYFGAAAWRDRDPVCLCFPASLQGPLPLCAAGHAAPEPRATLAGRAGLRRGGGQSKLEQLRAEKIALSRTGTGTHSRLCPQL